MRDPAPAIGSVLIDLAALQISYVQASMCLAGCCAAQVSRCPVNFVANADPRLELFHVTTI